MKRHFREIDIDIQSTPFTVAASATCRATVFGNGMLLSRQQIRLVAAFDHRDIFLDPAPDPAISFAERARLFALPRSSWQDYDKSLISAGGGIHSRSSKSISLSEPVRSMLDLAKAEVTPQELMNAILKMRCDLMWFGGIGTYIRAADESDAEVGDRANDPIRIAGGDLRARVVGEGANLARDAARSYRGGPQGHPAQHRCHRQLRGRQHLGRRGQHSRSRSPCPRAMAASMAKAAMRCWQR